MKGGSIGLFLALTASIRPGWKGLPGLITVAYYEHSKKVFNIEPSGCAVKPFKVVVNSESQ